MTSYIVNVLSFIYFDNDTWSAESVKLRLRDRFKKTMIEDNNIEAPAALMNISTARAETSLTGAE